MAVISFGMAALLWFGVPDVKRQGKESFAEQLRGTRQILSSERFWRVVPLTLLNQGIFLAVQTLWVTAFMRDVQDLGPARARVWCR
jgi:predicted MFS family arabinose efflux permease